MGPVSFVSRAANKLGSFVSSGQQARQCVGQLNLEFLHEAGVTRGELGAKADVHVAKAIVDFRALRAPVVHRLARLLSNLRLHQVDAARVVDEPFAVIGALLLDRVDDGL